MNNMRKTVRHEVETARQVFVRLAVVVGAVTTLLLGAAALSAAEQMDAARLMDRIEQRFKENRSRGSTRIDARLSRESFPKASQAEISKIIAEQQQRVTAKYGNDPSHKDRMAAIEYNIRNKLDNHIVEEYALNVTQKGAKWRLDHVINKFDESVVLPPELSSNEYAHKFDLSTNRSRTYAWDGDAHRVLFSTDDPKSRSMQLYSSDRNSALADRVLELGSIPKALWEHIKEPQVKASITDQSDDSITMTLTMEGTPWKATIVALPRQGYSLSRMEVETGPGMRYRAEYGDYKLIDGNWYPETSMDEWTQLRDGKEVPIRRQALRIASASFHERIDDDDVFSFSAPHNSSVQDYRGPQPFTFRTDEGLGVTEEQLGAMVSLIAPKKASQATQPASVEHKHHVEHSHDESTHNHDKVEAAQPQPSRSNTPYIMFMAIGVVIVLTAAATSIVTRRRHE